MEEVKLSTVDIQKPEGINFILGQSHFIKTVEDLHEALVTAVAGIRFGLAFCEASGPRLVRFSGTDKKMISLAKDNLEKIGAGHSFIIFLDEGSYPINVLGAVKNVAEVVNIFCATSNPTQVIVAESKKGRGIIGVIDGQGPKGVETQKDILDRKEFLKNIGYKL
ncbi:adenosine-specific kinase [Candidatus Woesebacteria bacterium]|nr:adenosine-specific kinase [Candidatus Woesebacteria bacterium]